MDTNAQSASDVELACEESKAPEDAKAAADAKAEADVKVITELPEAREVQAPFEPEDADREKWELVQRKMNSPNLEMSDAERLDLLMYCISLG